MEWYLKRKPTAPDWMFGELTAGDFHCFTLEDELREIKIKGETAIPAGRYELIMEYSPKFGRELLTLLHVDNFNKIRIHSVRDDDDTEGCIGVGNQINQTYGKISGGLNAGVEDKLEALWEECAQRGERVWLTITNAVGDRYVDTHNLVGEELA